MGGSERILPADRGAGEEEPEGGRTDPQGPAGPDREGGNRADKK